MFYFLLPLPVAWLTLSLIAQYYDYYDIGVNAGANAGGLLFFVAPPLLVMLYVTAWLVLVIAKRFAITGWRTEVIGSAVLIAIGMGTFFWAVWQTKDYPTEKSQNLRMFIMDVFVR